MLLYITAHIISHFNNQFHKITHNTQCHNMSLLETHYVNVLQPHKNATTFQIHTTREKANIYFPSS